MTVSPDTPATAGGPATAIASAALHPAGSSWLDARMAWLADRLNPILVKETRQALRGRQFLFTFALMLAAAWVWSIFGAAIIGPGLRYGAHGWTIFVGYYLILAVPLLLIVPFTAFRSLAAERDDRTLELVTITQLRARGIVAGKLASAVAQMLIYVSVITPCIASTWLLRGVDFSMMLLLVLLVFLLSIGLSLVALLLATLPRTRQQQTVLTVALVGGLTCMGLMFLSFTAQFSYNASPTFTPDMLPAVITCLAMYAGYAGLMFLAASSQLMPPSENRSTHLRLGLIVCQAIVLGAAAGLQVHYRPTSASSDAFFAWAALLGVHWYFAGVFLTGESPDLPRRVQRGLPTSLAGRALGMLLQPGPATGLWFVIANALVAFTVLDGGYRWVNPGLSSNSATRFHFLACGIAYLVVFLGTGKLLIDLLHRRSWWTPVAVPAVHLLLMLVACLVPLTVYLAAGDLRGTGWSLLQLTNPLWTLVKLMDGASPVEATDVLIFLLVAAAATLLANLPSTLREIARPALALPARLRQELAEQAAAKQAARPSAPSSPWSNDTSPSAPT